MDTTNEANKVPTPAELRAKANQCAAHAKALIAESREFRREGYNRTALRRCEEAEREAEKAAALRDLATKIELAEQAKLPIPFKKKPIFKRIASGFARLFAA